MIVYRNHYLGREKRSKGYSFHPTAFSATAAAQADAPKGTVEVEQDVIDAQLNKEGVMDMLRRAVPDSLSSNHAGVFFRFSTLNPVNHSPRSHPDGKIGQ
jgi:hypothetical protein